VTQATSAYPEPANPYAKFLGDRDAKEVIAQTPVRLTELARKLGKDGLEKSLAPGKWSVREILCHLADCEVVFAFRLRQALAEDNAVIQPFDQNHWAKPYARLTAQDALDAFSTLRRWNLALIATLSPADLARTTTHPERGPMTMQTIVETMGGHDTNHLVQVETIAANN